MTKIFLIQYFNYNLAVYIYLIQEVQAALVLITQALVVGGIC